MDLVIFCQMVSVVPIVIRYLMVKVMGESHIVSDDAGRRCT